MDDQIWGYKKESGLPELPEVGKLQVKNAAWPMPMESHPDAVEFLLLRSGCKQIQVEDRLYEMQGGDLLVVFPGERHGAEDFVQNRTSLAYLLMAVPTEVPRFCMLEEEERSALWEQLKLLKGRMLKVSPSVCRTMDRLFDHVNTGLPLERARIRTELMRFLFQILEEAGEEDKSLPADIAAVIRYIREAREEMPDIAKMAALVNLSESRFKQKFKQATGIPPRGIHRPGKDPGIPDASKRPRPDRNFHRHGAGLQLQPALLRPFPEIHRPLPDPVPSKPRICIIISFCYGSHPLLMLL